MIFLNIFNFTIHYTNQNVIIYNNNTLLLKKINVIIKKFPKLINRNYDDKT